MFSVQKRRKEVEHWRGTQPVKRLNKSEAAKFVGLVVHMWTLPDRATTRIQADSAANIQQQKHYRAMAVAVSSATGAATEAASEATWDSFIMRGWSSSATSPLQPV
jgi:hypothetical protein